MRLQLMRSYETDSNGFNTKRELKTEAAELKTKGKDLRSIVMLLTVQQDSL